MEADGRNHTHRYTPLDTHIQERTDMHIDRCIHMCKGLSGNAWGQSIAVLFSALMILGVRPSRAESGVQRLSVWAPARQARASIRSVRWSHVCVVHAACVRVLSFPAGLHSLLRGRRAGGSIDACYVVCRSVFPLARPSVAIRPDESTDGPGADACVRASCRARCVGRVGRSGCRRVGGTDLRRPRPARSFK